METKIRKIAKVDEKADDKIDPAEHHPANEDDGSARVRVLNAATKLFADKGLEGTSTRDIAKAADLNISLISYYFGGKEGLYKTVIREFAETAHDKIGILLKTVDPETMTRESFQETMRVFIQGMLEVKFARPEINILLQREMMAGLPHSKDVYENIFSSILERVVSVYRIAQQKGIVRSDLNPYVIFISLSHATDMYLHLNHCPVRVHSKLPQIPKELNSYIHQIYTIFVEGVLV